MDLCGKVAVITGGKRIGRVVARELAGRGMNLVLSYRAPERKPNRRSLMSNPWRSKLRATTSS
jgi:NAD(P)-dependent dehydrogenase (short-subunit alcohol dehydrogenase family)